MAGEVSPGPTAEPAPGRPDELGPRPPTGVRWAVAALRLVHPFPSLLDGVVVALVALVAGGSVPVALGLGLSMTLLQCTIGTVNDIVDAPRDAGIKAGKPIPDGVVSTAQARLVAAACAGGGLLLALIGGPALVALALVVLGIGLAYDLRAKGTSLSWLPFALGIPLLPVYGWFGATGSLPGLFLVLVPAAANAGTALAIANAVVDIERDAAAGVESIAVALGARRASTLVVILHAVVAVLALATAVVLGAPTGWVAAIVLAATAPIAGAVLGVAAVRRPGASWRELAWEIQAIGTGLLAVAWLGALSASAGTPLAS